MLLGMALNTVAFLLAATLQVFISLFPRKVSFLFQLPQFIIVSAAEVLVYKTALVFAYQEAPSSMKSVMQAFFMLTISLGNIMISILTLLSHVINSQTLEYALYAMLQVLAACVFYFQIRNYRYRPVEPSADALELISGGSITVDEEEDL